MGTPYARRLSRSATALVIAAALTVPLTRLHAQQPAALADGSAAYDIACSIQSASGVQDCGAPPQGHTCDVEANYASQSSRESTAITFVNRSDKPVKIYWLNFRGERVLYKSLPPGGQLAQQTFVGHNWLVTTSTEQCIGIFETVPESIADEESVAVAPPELPIYQQPSPPAEDLVWTPGFWAWSAASSDYYWVPGTWAAAPIVGYLWTPGYWVARHGRFVWLAGYWGPHVGFYGGINYGHGYSGRGYVGGSWRDGRMMYNSAVTNLDNFHSNHTYSQTGSDGPAGRRASYSGDNVRPNDAEATAAGEYHIPPTAAQLQHLHAARVNPALPQTHAGTLSITHSAPPRPPPNVVAEVSHHDAPAAATSKAVHPRNPARTPPPLPPERAAQSATEPQSAPKENQQPRPKSATATRTTAPHAEGQHTR